MTGHDLRNARKHRGWTQQQAAKRLGMTQAYLSMLEGGRRALSRSAVRRVLRKLRVPPTVIPLPQYVDRPTALDDFVRDQLGVVGYPGFAYTRKCRDASRNPAEVLFVALNEGDLDARVVEGLPWLVFKFEDLDWDWLIRHAKLNDRQNRLGFAVTLARQLAQRTGDQRRTGSLAEKEILLQKSLLAREDTFCHDSMTDAERRWLRAHRTPEARHWNLLSDLDAKHLTHAIS